MRTATNPETGEKVQFDEASGEWVPMAAPDWQSPEDVPSADMAGPDTELPSGALGLTWPGEGPLSMLDAAPPIIAAPVHGLMTSRAAVRAGAEVGAAASAVVDPIAKALSAATDAVKGKPIDAALWLGEKVPGYIGQKSAQAGAARNTKELLQQVRGQVASVPSAGSAGAVQRARPGLLASDDLAQKLGLPDDVLSDAQRADLDQAVDVTGKLRGDIKKARAAEMEALYTGAAGPKALENLAKVRTGYTNKIISEAGFPEGVIPDPGAISDVRRAAGREIGQVLEERFPSDIVTMVPEHSVSRVIASETADEAAPALKLLKNYGAVKEGADGEIVDAADMSLKNYQRLRTELEKLSSTTKNNGVRGVADSLLARMDATAYEGLDDIGKEALSNARYRYKILSKLQEPGVITNGEINPKSFGKQWMRGESKNMRHFNELATLSDTVSEVTQTATPGTTGKRAIDAVGEGVVGVVARAAGL